MAQVPDPLAKRGLLACWDAAPELPMVYGEAAPLVAGAASYGDATPLVAEGVMPSAFVLML